MVFWRSKRVKRKIFGKLGGIHSTEPIFKENRGLKKERRFFDVSSRYQYLSII